VTRQSQFLHKDEIAEFVLSAREGPRNNSFPAGISETKHWPAGTARILFINGYFHVYYSGNVPPGASKQEREQEPMAFSMYNNECAAVSSFPGTGRPAEKSLRINGLTHLKGEQNER